MLVRTLLEARHAAAVHTMESGRPLGDAAALMCGEKVPLLVVTRDDVPVGALSRGDILAAMMKGPVQAALDSPVREAMTPTLMAVGPDDRTDAALEMVTGAGIRHLPVIEGNRVLGILSAAELFQKKMEAAAAELRYLQEYITDLHEASFD
ncbi:CBS domain-containing protein [Desulfococcus sp.]|uniref:CBS domain-containing protein n=1 Tax=Desulfococcus sp. TaxID=2025834 RepID=UPI00359339C5